MDRERLDELLQDPARVAQEDLESLRSMAGKYPWFNAAHLLLAVGEHGSRNVLANDRDSLPAAFLPSRAVLFDLVHKEEADAPAGLRVARDEEPGPQAEGAPPVAQVPEPLGVIHPLPSAAVPTSPEHSATSTATPSEAPAAEASGPAATADDGLDVLELQMRQAIQAEGHGLQGAASPAPPAAPASESAHQANSSAGQRAEAPLPAPPAHVARPKGPPPGARLRFTDWLEQGQESDAGPGVPKLPQASTLPVPPVKPKGPAPSQREILDRFIQQATPPRPAEKAAFFNPQQAAKRSLQDDGLVSETLARIHEQQGSFTKAREIYDRLAVKHPDKSVYFAALSKALEGRVNN